MDSLIELQPLLWQAAYETVYIVALTLLFGGIGGLVLGLALYLTRGGALFANRVVFGVLNVVVNVFRPIPFIIFLTGIGPLTIALTGSRIGTEAFIVPATIMAFCELA